MKFVLEKAYLNADDRKYVRIYKKLIGGNPFPNYLNLSHLNLFQLTVTFILQEPIECTLADNKSVKYEPVYAEVDLYSK